MYILIISTFKFYDFRTCKKKKKKYFKSKTQPTHTLARQKPESSHHLLFQRYICIRARICFIFSLFVCTHSRIVNPYAQSFIHSLASKQSAMPLYVFVCLCACFFSLFLLIIQFFSFLSLSLLLNVYVCVCVCVCVCIHSRTLKQHIQY